MINLDDLLEGQELDNIRKQVQQNQPIQQQQQNQQQQQIIPDKETYYKYVPLGQKLESIQEYLDFRIEQEEKLIIQLQEEQKQIEKEIRQNGIDICQDEVELRIMNNKYRYMTKRKEQIQTIIDNVNDQEDIKQLQELIKQTQEEIDKFEPIESLLKQLSEIQFQLQYLEGVKGLYKQYMNGKSVDDYIEMHEKTKQYLEIIKEINNTHNDPQFLEKKSSEHQTIVRYSKNLDQYLMKVFEMDKRLKKDIEIQENQIKQLEDQQIYLRQFKQEQRNSQNIFQYLIVIFIILFQLSLMYFII